MQAREGCLFPNFIPPASASSFVTLLSRYLAPTPLPPWPHPHPLASWTSHLAHTTITDTIDCTTDLKAGFACTREIERATQACNVRTTPPENPPQPLANGKSPHHLHPSGVLLKRPCRVSAACAPSRLYTPKTSSVGFLPFLCLLIVGKSPTFLVWK